MTLKQFTLIALTALCSISLTSCSNDDDSPAPFSIAGSYEGIYHDNNVGDISDASIITDNGDGTYNIIAPAFTIGKAEYGAMTLKNIELIESEDGYIFQNESHGVKVTFAGNEAQRKTPTIMEFAAHLNGTLSKSGQLDFTLDLNHANTIYFYFVFSGKK